MAKQRAIVLLLVVLGLHLVLLDWLRQSLPSASILQPIAQTMFTREIVQAPAPEPQPISKPNKPSRHIQPTVSPTTAIANSSTVAAPAVDAIEPIAAPPAVVQSTPESTPTAVLGPTNGVVNAATPEATGDDWPANTRLSYGLTGFFRGPVKGDAQVQWQKELDRYQVSVTIDLGIISTRMTSQGRIGAERLEPSAYEEKTGPTVRSLLLESSRIRLMSGEWVNRPPEVQDTASQFVELAHRFSKQPALLAVGKAVPVWLARPGGVDEWTYDVVELVNLQSEHLGTVPAYHLKPRPLAKPRGPVAAELWFAPSLQYLPVRIRLTVGAEAWLDLMVEKIEQQ